jgi:hypothetical protein
MSRTYSFLTPATPTAATLFSASLATVTSTADIVVGYKTIIGIGAGGTNGANAPLYVRFGDATKIANASVADWIIPGGTVQWFDMGTQADRLRIFNPGSGSVQYVVYLFTVTG